jgi:hypothetical protein
VHRLKYQRFGVTTSLPDILKNDSASYLCVSDKLLALGTHSGRVSDPVPVIGSTLRPPSALRPSREAKP